MGTVFFEPRPRSPRARAHAPRGLGNARRQRRGPAIAALLLALLALAHPAEARRRRPRPAPAPAKVAPEVAPADVPLTHALGVDAALGTLTATVCLEGTPPRALVNGLAAARPHLRAAWALEGVTAVLEPARTSSRAAPVVARPIPTAGGEIPWPRGARCVRYAVSLDAALASGDPELARASGRDRVLAPDLWLWTPEDARDRERGVALALPDGISLLAAWPEVDGTRRVVPASTFTLPAAIALTHARTSSLALEAHVVRWAVLDAPRAPPPAAVRAWVAAAARAVVPTWSSRLEPSLAIIVTTTRAASGDPVGGGMSTRGGGPTVEVEVDVDATEDALVGEWVLVHELAHFAHPALARDAMAIGEGLASYLQCTRRVAAGLLDERTGWQRLVDGFERGRLDAARLELDLHEATRQVHAQRAYHRVYWSGAAMALLADVRLQREGRSVVEVFRAVVDGLDADTRARRLTLEQVAARFDDAIDAKIMRQTLSAGMGRKTLPPVEEALEKLGVRILDGVVALDDRAPLAPLRRRMMGLE